MFPTFPNSFTYPSPSVGYFCRYLNSMVVHPCGLLLHTNQFLFLKEHTVKSRLKTVMVLIVNLTQHKVIWEMDL